MIQDKNQGQVDAYRVKSKVRIGLGKKIVKKMVKNKHKTCRMPIFWGPIRGIPCGHLDNTLNTKYDHVGGFKIRKIAKF